MDNKNIYKIKQKDIDRLYYQQVNNTQIPSKLAADNKKITSEGNYYAISNAEELDIPKSFETNSIEFCNHEPIVKMSFSDGTNTLTQFENDIMDVLYSVSLLAPKYYTHFSVTPEQIYKIYTGNRKKRIHDNEFFRLHAVLRKLSGLRVCIFHPKIDLCKTTEKLIEKSGIPHENYTLNWKEIAAISFEAEGKAEMNSEVKKVRTSNVSYIFERKFPLQQYALGINESVLMNLDFLSVDSSFSLNEENVTIMRYIAKRVMLIRNKNNNISNHMALYYPSGKDKGLLESLGYEWKEDNTWKNDKIYNQYKKTLSGKNWKKKRKEITALIGKYLNFLKDMGYVGKYFIKRQGATDSRNKPIVTYIIYPGRKKDKYEMAYYDKLAEENSEYYVSWA